MVLGPSLSEKSAQGREVELKHGRISMYACIGRGGCRKLLWGPVRVDLGLRKAGGSQPARMSVCLLVGILLAKETFCSVFGWGNL